MCDNCEGENAKTGHVELWDRNICPECGKKFVPEHGGRKKILMTTGKKPIHSIHSKII